MSACTAYSSDPDLDVSDVSGNGVEIDVARNLMDGTIRLSVLWTDEIHLSPEGAKQVAYALLRAAGDSRILYRDVVVGGERREDPA
ncbi:hypothetical protein AB0F96_18995 [Streptomyces sp. NPDC023998]|uniref:hypothetical protein n=1 Tax=Streptomyces sp. NPDC023998 TaxID=3154597 RepID=UPI0033E5E1C9